MKRLYLILFWAAGLAAQSLDQFILIKGASFEKGDVGRPKARPLVRINEYEILDHAVSNGEYKLFTDATSYPVPLHWVNGAIPAGKEHYPVVFVNRDDVRAFLNWLSKRDNRLYRLPRIAELEYAQRGGLKNNRYPWGDGEPKGKANYDEKGERPFNRWNDYLQPSRSGKPNGYGLYGLAGNVWQMAISQSDPATISFKYRIDDLDNVETGIMGGSWARTAEYLRCGYVLGLESGIRYPDTGFRPVRAPAGTDWTIQPRQLVVLSQGTNSNFLSWALLPGDDHDGGFNVYRAASRDQDGFRINQNPVRSGTTFVDTDIKSAPRYNYYVRPVNRAGKEGLRSEWYGCTTKDEPGKNIITTFAPLYRQGSLVPIFGDLSGDGVMDCVIKLDNGNSEMSQDPGVPVQLEAFTSYGRSLWRKDVCWHDHCYGNSNNVPFNVWDMDGDGRAEVVTMLQQGDDLFVALLDGMTGKVKKRAPWPAMVSDFEKSSTRVHLSVVYLNPKTPAVITQSGLYENEIFTAFDNELNQLWQYKSFAETSGSGGHKIEAADVDGDGCQEIFDGTTCLNHDGTMRWSIYRQHPDIVSIHDYIPERPGLEVFYIVESSVHAGVYLVDANSGAVIWKHNREEDPIWTHAHSGWSADIWDGSKGMECISNRTGHGDNYFLLFSATGKLLLQPFPAGYRPLEWDGDATRELETKSANTIGDFDGEKVVPKEQPPANLIQDGRLIMVADIYGDFRDELILNVPTDKGGRAITVVSAATQIPFRYLSATSDREYRLWIARNMGGGYASVYDRELKQLR
jgi:formylglycine-generating enzyme required for sulfatase activity